MSVQRLGTSFCDFLSLTDEKRHRARKSKSPYTSASNSNRVTPTSRCLALRLSVHNRLSTYLAHSEKRTISYVRSWWRLQVAETPRSRAHARRSSRNSELKRLEEAVDMIQFRFNEFKNNERFTWICAFYFCPFCRMTHQIDPLIGAKNTSNKTEGQIGLMLCWIRFSLKSCDYLVNKSKRVKALEHPVLRVWFGTCIFPPMVLWT